MTKRSAAALCLTFTTGAALAFQGMGGAVSGSVKKIDSASKTLVVTTADGADHTFHYLGRTTVHGAEAAGTGGKEALHGLKEGSEVAVHYTTRGGADTAEEIDRLGKDGLKSTEGTVKAVDRGTKKVTIVAADGSEQTFHLGERAAADSGKDLAEGADKSAKVTVYYTERGGEKVAHFFKKL
jgi:Cu/Ag efflux protein CusF